MNQRLALGIMLAGHNVMLTGAAGVGKTYVLNEFIRQAKRQAKRVSVTATTGLAASHLGGNTIHAWSGLGVHDALPNRFYEFLSKGRREIIAKTDVLIIDEISMLHDFRLDMVEEICRTIRQNDQPFGGIQVILCGDFFQLPPINRPGGPSGGFAVNSGAWQQLDLVTCYITEQHRQADDVYLEFLTALRTQDLRRRHLDNLLSRHQAKLQDQVAVTELHTTNVDVDAINSRELQKLPGKLHVYDMDTSGKANYVETLQRSCLAPLRLELKKGALVMCIKNSPDKKYVNGSLGVVTGFDKTSGLPEVQLNNGRQLTIGYESWELRDGTKKRAAISQIPLRLAWAITVHKSQGMTLDAARIDLRRAFVEGMGYVALSRVRGLAQLSLVGLNRMSLQVSAEALAIDRQLRAQSEADAKKYAALEHQDPLRHGSAANRQSKPAEATGGWAEKLAAMRQKYPKAYQPWAAEDDARLQDLFIAGRDLPFLTEALERQPGSIRARLKKLLGDDILGE
jgi:ATP-dependent exoDNAse (exonuclease V) alpha subunit